MFREIFKIKNEIKIKIIKIDHQHGNWNSIALVVVWIFLIYLYIYLYILQGTGDLIDSVPISLLWGYLVHLIWKKKEKKRIFFPSFDLVCLKIKWVILILAFNWRLNWISAVKLATKLMWVIEQGPFFFPSFKVELIWIWAAQNISKIMTWHMSTFHGFGATNFTVAKQKN